MKLGELFIDLDFRTGGAINKLTNFSIKFLALKTAASQIGDTFDKMFGSVIDGVVQMENLNDVTGFNIEKMQKWKAVAEQNNVAFEDIVSGLKNLQQASADIMMGQGNAAPFTKLGIDMSRPREAFDLLNEIRTKIFQIKDAGLRRNLLQEMGLSENMLVLFKNFNGYFDKSLQLTAKERASVMELNKEWIALKQTLGFGWDKFWSKFADETAQGVKSVRELFTLLASGEVPDWLKKLGDYFKNVVNSSEGLSQFARDIKGIGKDLEDMIDVIDRKGEIIKEFFKGFGEGVWKGISEFFRGVQMIGGWLGEAIYDSIDTDGYDKNKKKWKDLSPAERMREYMKRMETPGTTEYEEAQARKRRMAFMNPNGAANQARMTNTINNANNNVNNNINNSSVNDARNINITNNITSSRPVDREMVTDVMNTTAQQIGNVGYLTNG